MTLGEGIGTEASVGRVAAESDEATPTAAVGGKLRMGGDGGFPAATDEDGGVAWYGLEISCEGKRKTSRLFLGART